MSIYDNIFDSLIVITLLFVGVLFFGYPILSLIFEYTSIDPGAYHQYFAPTGSGIHLLFTWSGVLAFVVMPISILCLLWAPIVIYEIANILSLSKLRLPDTPITDKVYEKWCKKFMMHFSFLNCIPSNIENFRKMNRDSYIFLKEDEKNWRLFKLNSSDQEDWNPNNWKAEENEILISQDDSLLESLNEISIKNPEEIKTRQKMDILFQVLDLEEN